MITISALAAIDFSAEPLPSGWKGALAHIGPVQTITPLVELLSGKTTCGTLALMSGVMLWGSARLRPFTAVDYLEELATAGFAWQTHWRYLQTRARPSGAAPDQPIQESAAMSLRGLFLRSILEPDDWLSFYQPLMPASHMVNIVQFILPKSARQPFKQWLTQTCDRLDSIAEIPDIQEPDFDDFESEEAYDLYCAPCRGAPLPPEVLDPATDISRIDLIAAATKFVASLDHTKNRYLKSPAQMLEEGFKGTPYGKAT